MTRPKIAFVGMTHLGLISAVAASEKGFQVFCFDPDINLIESLKKSEPPVSEPQLIELMAKNYKLLQFSCDPKTLKNCPVIYVAPDVSTDDQGQSDLGAINKLLNIVFENTTKKM
jgi:UDPglucose 6-dehydrogenase